MLPVRRPRSGTELQVSIIPDDATGTGRRHDWTPLGTRADYALYERHATTRPTVWPAFPLARGRKYAAGDLNPEPAD